MFDYPFHIGDYVTGTAHLSNDEDLAYRRMIDLYYQKESALCVDEISIARRIRMPVDTVRTILAEFFTLSGDGYHNGRCDREIAKYRKRVDDASRAGKVSAQRRSNKSDTDERRPFNDRSTTVQQTNNDRATNLLPSSLLPSSRKPTSQDKEKNTTPPSGVSQQVWDDFLKLRKGLKAPVTATAIAGIEKEAKKAGLTTEAALSMCCARGWRGFKAEWVKLDKVDGEKVGDDHMEQFEELWNDYRRPDSKGSKVIAEQEWKNLSLAQKIEAYEKEGAYLSATSKEDGKYRAKIERYLKERLWEGVK